MTTQQFQDILKSIIVSARAKRSLRKVMHVRTFADDGLLTDNVGLVVTVGGSEFQVQIVRSK